MKTSIAVCGKANAGKTSFITTLRHEYSGAIKDVHNTTTTVVDYSHGVLEIILSDFPGFEKMSGVEGYLNLEKEDPEYAYKYKNVILGDEFSRREYDLLSEIRKRDIVFIVCSIENSPDASHETEIKLIQQVNPNIIAIISKTGNLEKKERISTWKFLLERMGITDVIEFDAHFTDDKNIVRLMNYCIKFIKNPEQATCLEKSIEKFDENFRKQYNEIQQSFVNLIKGVRQANTYTGDEAGQDTYFKERFSAVINKEFQSYLQKITTSLGLDLEELKTLSKTININVSYEEETYDNEGRKIGFAAGLAGGVATLLALGPPGLLAFLLYDIAGAVVGDKIGETIVKKRVV